MRSEMREARAVPGTEPDDPTVSAGHVYRETVRLSDRLEGGGEPLEPTGPSPEERDRTARRHARETLRAAKNPAGGRPEHPKGNQ